MVYAVAAYLVYFILSRSNLLSVKKAAEKTSTDVAKAKQFVFMRNTFIRVLSYCDSIYYSFGLEASVMKLEQYRFMLQRTNIKLPYIERSLSETELLGMFKGLKFISCFLGLFLTVTTTNPVYLMLFFMLLIDTVVSMFLDMCISEEDKEIEDDFPEFFLILYSRLKRGTDIRLAPTLDEYLKSLEVMGAGEHKAMVHFVSDLRRNIEIYGDDSMAINKLRTTYKSAAVVNFFNLAVQALKGVDNSDKLLAFKMELSQKSLDKMTREAEQRILKGQRAITCIFFILAQFVIISWVAKTGFVSI